MTTRRSMMNNSDDWTVTFAQRERRKNVAIGIAGLLAVALFTALVIAYFGGAAAMPW